MPRNISLPRRVGAVAAAVLLMASGTAVAQHSVARQWNDEVLDAIRVDFPRPPVHARNLWHLSIAMWDAWAAYDDKADQYLVHERHTADDVEAARAEAISYAAYRILTARYALSPGYAATRASLDAKMTSLGYDPTNYITVGDSPAALGNRIAVEVLAFGLADNANEQQDFIPNNGYVPVNDPLIFDFPMIEMADPNRWQPLAFDFLITQNGIEVGETVQEFVCPHWEEVSNFALRRDSAGDIFLDPGTPPPFGSSEFKDAALQIIEFSSRVDPAQTVMVDISPNGRGNNTLGQNDGTGHAVNPVTGMPYAPQFVKEADFGRVIAEFWADGPDSETPPGHWNTLANYVSDHPDVVKQIGGTGPILNDLEWDVKVYLAINGAVHDAAVAAWGCKGIYDYVRPISMIRYMASLGQSSDPLLPSYDPNGLPLVPGLVELITTDTVQPGQRHAHLAPYVNRIAIYAWNGEPADPMTQVGGVGWILAELWLPYQRDTFVTPPFAGYVSGHSTFSRAAAEVLTGITGSEFFPGGLGEFYAPMNNYLVFEEGPTTDVTLQWATYYDASDEAGLSRLWGGIHVRADDGPGRIMGSYAGKWAWDMANRYYDGRISCPANFNGDGVVDVFDLLDYLSEWFSGTEAAEMTFDTTVDVFDLLEYLNSWFMGC